MNNDNKKDIDPVTGVETTGHEWDGLKELNLPAPRWWLWVFYVTVIWAVGYFVFYPAWPTLSGHTEGKLGYTEYKELAESQKEIMARQEVHLSKFHNASFDEIMNTPDLYDFAKAGGAAAFKNNCAQCHGTGGTGSTGYPNLNDDDWLWGGKIADIYQTIQFGIRADHEQTRTSQMPSFGKDNLLKTEEVDAVVDYVLTLSGGEHKPTYDQGKDIFAAQCTACHGAEGKGGRDFGAPNLTDKIWLYGGDRASVYNTVFNAHAGIMPAWVNKLDQDTIRELTVYVHSLGGGEKSEVAAPTTASDASATAPTAEVAPKE